MPVPARDVSVVVCAYTMVRWDEMVAALDSARNQEPHPAELILVVDHNDELVRRARAELDGVTIVENAGRRGLSGARNTGVTTASCGIVAFLDDDAAAQPGWLAGLLAPYSDPAVLGTGGSAIAAWDHGRPSWFPQEFGWVVGCSYRGQPETVAAVRNPLGCSMSFRRSVFGRVGGFRPEVGRVGTRPAGCEETEFCIRVQKRYPGGQIIHVPSSRVRHRVPAARASVSYFSSRCFAEGRSKAIVASFAGTRSGLSSERAYALRTLPRGVMTELASVVRGDPWGAARATAIAFGLGMTTLGYLVGSLESRSGVSSPLDKDTVEVTPVIEQDRVVDERAPMWEPLTPPIKTLDVEVSGPIPRLDDRHAGGDRYRRALALVQYHGIPLGSLEVAIPPGGLSGEEVGTAARLEFGARIAELERDEVPDATSSKERKDRATVPPLSVVIATRDRAERVGACIAAILATDYPLLEIVIVDNASTSDATARLIAARFSDRPEVRYLHEKPGTSRARNRGWRAARSDIVAFLDDDVVIDRRWASAIVRPFVDDDRVGCVTGLVLPAELETNAQLWMEEYGGFAKGYVPKIHDPDEERSRTDLFPFAAGAFGTGASMAFRRSVLERFGGFDPALGGGTIGRGGEDLAAFVDVLLDGWRLAYEPRAIARHFHRRGYDDLRRQIFSYGCGLSAYLTRTAMRHPDQIVNMGHRTIRGLGHLLDPRSPKNARKRRGYPTRLTVLELAGVAWGPIAYVRSRVESRRPFQARLGVDGPPPASSDEPR